MKSYDTSWDEDNEDAWDQMYEQWEERDWESWLINNFSFPFTVIRKEDDRDFMPDYDDNGPFIVGHTFDIRRYSKPRLNNSKVILEPYYS